MSKFHNALVNSNISKYIISNLNSNKIADIIRKYFLIHFKKYNKYKKLLLLKLLMPSNQIKNIRIQRSSSHYMFSIINKHFFSHMKIITEQLYSKVLELGITFVSTSKNMTC